MKLKCLLFSIIFTLVAKAQPLDINKIDTSNYCDYSIFHTDNQKYLKGKELMAGFLHREEVVPIILDELKRIGHAGLSDVLYKTDNGQYIVLDVYDLDSKTGFVYIEIFYGGGKAARSIKNPYIDLHKAEYVQCVRSKEEGFAEVNIIKKLPENIKVLNADWYWFQLTEIEADNQYLITKEIAKKMLKQDVNKYFTH